MDAMDKQEMISALADGQLQGEAFARAVQATADDASLRARWDTYHLIGDVLRSGERAAVSSNSAFMARLQARLEAEAAPAAMPVAVPIPAVQVPAIARPAANDPSFRWKLVAGFASVAAIAAITWSAAGTFGAGASGQAELAKAPQSVQQPVTLASGERQVMIRDARLDELMAAHRQFGGAPALQTSAGFLRNATFEGPAR